MAHIRCGHCKGDHSTVAQVKLCAHRAEQARIADEIAEAEALAEMEAEARNERYFEEGSEAFQASLFAEYEEERMRIGYTNTMGWH